jgi:hypothetical protein
MASLLAKINEAAGSEGTRSPNDPLFDSYVWQSPSELFEHQPTFRIDYNLTDNHRLSGSYSFITAKREPDYLNSADPASNSQPPDFNHAPVARALRCVEEHDQRGARPTAFYGFALRP